MLNNFESCPVCQEQTDQCLSCASYVVDGERIYYEKLKDFGATQDHELRFIRRIQKHRTTAFFHKGKLYIPSRQGRSVPLAIGLQWEAWEEQQEKVNELENRVNAALARANMTCLGGPMFFKQFDDVLAILRGKEPLNHEQEETFAEFHLRWFAMTNADLSEEEVKKLYDRVYGHSRMQPELHDHEEIWKLQQKNVDYWKKAYKNLKLQLQNKEIDAQADAKKIAELENRTNAALKIIESLLVCEMYAHDALKLERALSGESNGQV